jgi:DNA replication protein DnaC
LEIIEDRDNERSTIIAGQLPIKEWHKYIGDPAVADAALDRVVHGAHEIKLVGDSLRKKRSALTKENDSAK